MVFLSEGINLDSGSLVMYLVYFLVGVGIKSVMDLISVNIYAEIMMKIRHKSEVPVGAREAFKYLYKKYVGAIWHTVLVTIVFTIIIVYGVMGDKLYKYLIINMLYVLLAQVTQFLRIYIVSKT